MILLDIANGWKTAIMIVAMIAVFYLFLIKPQSDKAKKEAAYRAGLKQGDRVRLKHIGMLKLEIESEKVDAPEDFNGRKHIRGVRLHLLPESRRGRQEVYEDVKFERWREE